MKGRSFETAKSAEVANWLNTGTVCRILRDKLPAEQVLRCRWIYTWKPIESPTDQLKAGGRSHKAKARLVVLGYLDPALEEIPRDSPTLGRQSRMLILTTHIVYELGSHVIRHKGRVFTGVHTRKNNRHRASSRDGQGHAAKSIRNLQT